MLSDALSEVVERIDYYLAEFPDVYDGELPERVIKARDELDAIRTILDAPPAANLEHAEG